MDTLIYVIIAILILLYIIDKKEPLPPMVDIQPAVKVKKDHELLTNREKRDKIYKNMIILSYRKAILNHSRLCIFRYTSKH